MRQKFLSGNLKLKLRYNILLIFSYFKDPTPIQRQAIPIGLLNRDIIGVAETGRQLLD